MLLLILQCLYTNEPILLTFLQRPEGVSHSCFFLPLSLLMMRVLEAVFFLAAGRLQDLFSFPFFVLPNEKYTYSVVCSNSQKLLIVTVA